MKKSVFVNLIIVASIVALACSCNKENVRSEGSTSSMPVQTKHVYQPDPSWTKVSSAVSILRSSNQNPLNCINQPTGNYCGMHVMQYLTDGPADVYIELGEIRGIQVKQSFLKANNSSSLVDSAENGYLTFHADIEIESKKLQEILGSDLIPAGRYPASNLGDSAIYVQFK